MRAGGFKTYEVGVGELGMLASLHGFPWMGLGHHCASCGKEGRVIHELLLPAGIEHPKDQTYSSR